eukprot:SAG31_NODE_8946_length_1358_cov_3.374901_1_plen_67_part_10
MHVFGLSGLVGNLAHVHSTQGMTGAAEINLSVMTSYAAKEEAAFRAEFDRKKQEREKAKGSSAAADY